MTSFIPLFSAVLEIMEQYQKCEGCDILAEAIPECLKNMILVLDNSGLFSLNPALRHLIFTKLAAFLPTLAAEISAAASAHPPVEQKEGGEFVPPASLRANPTEHITIARPAEPFSQRASHEAHEEPVYGLPEPREVNTEQLLPEENRSEGQRYEFDELVCCKLGVRTERGIISDF
jgi:hypothetical protein